MFILGPMLDKTEILELLQTDDERALFRQADEIRHKYVGDEVHLRALIEFRISAEIIAFIAVSGRVTKKQFVTV